MLLLLLLLLLLQVLKSGAVVRISLRRAFLTPRSVDGSRRRVELVLQQVGTDDINSKTFGFLS
jgi:hypothetical protein